MHEHCFDLAEIRGPAAAALDQEGFERGQGLVDVTGGGEFAVEHREVAHAAGRSFRLAAVARERLAKVEAPEGRSITGAVQVQREDFRIRFEQHRDRPGPLRRLAR